VIATASEMKFVMYNEMKTGKTQGSRSGKGMRKCKHVVT
jgi:hypothetical protein